METVHDLAQSSSRILPNADEQPPRSLQSQPSQVDLIDEAEDALSGASVISIPFERPQDQVIANSDVLSHILSYFTPEDLGPRQVYLNTILAVALTCRASCDTALDYLWQSMDTLLPLLKLLPSVVQQDGLYFYYGDIRADPRSSFYRYSHRIRSIFVRGAGRGDLRLLFPVLTRLALHLDTTMLPNLHKIHFESPDSETFIIIPLILPPSLISIEVSGHSLDTLTIDRFTRQFLPLFGTSGTIALRNLSVEDINNDFSSDFWESLSMVPTLETLRVSSRAMATMADIRRGLRALTLLTSLSLASTTPFAFQIPRRRSHRFPDVARSRDDDEEPLSSPIAARLTSCDVEFTVAQTTHGVISSSVPFPLTPWGTKATVNTSQLYETSLPAFCRWMAGWRNLRTLVVVSTASGADWPASCIHDLLRIPTLQELIMNIENLSSTDPAEADSVLDLMADIISEGRRLKSLSLPLRFGPALNSLRRFCNKVVGLEELSIGVDSSLTWDVVPSSSEQTSSTSSIRHLRIYDNRESAFLPQEYAKIAKYMMEVFPNLESMEPYHMPGYEANARCGDWEHIEYVRKLLKSNYRG